MADLPLRDRLLLALRSKLWRSYRQLCRAAVGKDTDLEVRHELTLLMGEGLVDFWDNSMRRFKLTIAGRNAAKRVWDAKQRRKAA